MAKPCRHGHVAPRNKYNQCMECARAHSRAYFQRNRDKRNAETRAYLVGWRARYPEKAKKAASSWRLAHPEQHVQNAIEWRRKNWTRIYRDRKTDPLKKLSNDLRAAIAGQVRKGGAKKGSKTEALIGCSIAHFKAHIERLWLPGMAWSNWGRERDCWQLDHIRPVASFDLTDPAQQRACFHYSNYQPLWALDNIRKGAKWAEAA